MKKIFKALLLLISLFSINIQNIFALEITDIYSNEALVVNLNTDEVLFSKDTLQESVQIASLTKVMTYVIAIENIDDLNTKIVVPEGTRQEIIDKDGSNAGLKDGYTYTAMDLLYGLMLPSGCDVAHVLAKYITNNDYDKFIEMMNEKAKELNMLDTIFYSASGLEENGKFNLSTEQDLYKLAKYAFTLPHFKEIIGTEFYEIKGTKNEEVVTNTVRNTNYMMGEYNGAEYYYQYSLGGKTGNLSGAGRCLISFAKKGDLDLVAVTLGVPNEHSNYHLTDHRKLFDYAFSNFTDNIEIDIESQYKSVGIGEKIQIVPVTSAKTKISWKSSDETVATVNEYGIVTGKKLGQVKITATTETGNQDYAYVSVGFYNGIDVKYSSGPSDPNGILGYGKIDWKLIKDYGIDFAVIRAGYALRNNPDSDPYFVTNVQDAFLNNINVMVSFDGYATDELYAKKEAEYLINYLNENIPDYLDKIDLPIVYNLFNSSVTDPALLVDIITTFNAEMQKSGYKVIVELGRTKLSTLELSKIEDLGIGIYVAWRPYVPDFSTKMFVENSDKIYYANLWSYRTDAYFGEVGIAKKIYMSAMYMDFVNINTSHEKHDDNLYPDIPTLKIEKEYVYTGINQVAEVIGFDENTMEISGNKETNAGVYTITVKPKTKWKNGSKEEITLLWEIKKVNPQFGNPEISTKKGTALKDINLPPHFSWKNEFEVVSDSGNFIAIYTPEDTNNYNTIEVELRVEVIKEEPQKSVNKNKGNLAVNKNNKNEEKETIIYEVINEEKLKHGLNDEKDLVLKIDSKNSLAIMNIYVDGKKITNNDYLIDEKVATITIKSGYLNTLNEGKHTINIIYENNAKTTAEFEILKEISYPNNEDEKNYNSIIILSIIVISIITIVSIIKIKKK